MVNIRIPPGLRNLAIAEPQKAPKSNSSEELNLDNREAVLKIELAVGSKIKHIDSDKYGQNDAEYTVVNANKDTVTLEGDSKFVVKREDFMQEFRFLDSKLEEERIEEAQAKIYKKIADSEGEEREEAIYQLKRLRRDETALYNRDLEYKIEPHHFKTLRYQGQVHTYKDILELIAGKEDSKRDASLNVVEQIVSSNLEALEHQGSLNDKVYTSTKEELELTLSRIGAIRTGFHEDYDIFEGEGSKLTSIDHLVRKAQKYTSAAALLALASGVVGGLASNIPDGFWDFDSSIDLENMFRDFDIPKHNTLDKSYLKTLNKYLKLHPKQHPHKQQENYVNNYIDKLKDRIKDKREKERKNNEKKEGERKKNLEEKLREIFAPETNQNNSEMVETFQNFLDENGQLDLQRFLSEGRLSANNEKIVEIDKQKQKELLKLAQENKGLLSKIWNGIKGGVSYVVSGGSSPVFNKSSYSPSVSENDDPRDDEKVLATFEDLAGNQLESRYFRMNYYNHFDGKNWSRTADSTEGDHHEAVRDAGIINFQSPYFSKDDFSILEQHRGFQDREIKDQDNKFRIPISEEIKEAIVKNYNGNAWMDAFEKVEHFEDFKNKASVDRTVLVESIKSTLKRKFSYVSGNKEVAEKYNASKDTMQTLNEIGTGDCDIVNTYLVGVLRDLGFEARLAVGYRTEDGRITQGDGHGWAEVLSKDGWVIVDGTPLSGNWSRSSSKDYEDLKNKILHTVEELVEEGDLKSAREIAECTKYQLSKDEKLVEKQYLEYLEETDPITKRALGLKYVVLSEEHTRYDQKDNVHETLVQLIRENPVETVTSLLDYEHHDTDARITTRKNIHLLAEVTAGLLAQEGQEPMIDEKSLMNLVKAYCVAEWGNSITIDHQLIGNMKIILDNISEEEKHMLVVEAIEGDLKHKYILNHIDPDFVNQILFPKIADDFEKNYQKTKEGIDNVKNGGMCFDEFRNVVLDAQKTEIPSALMGFSTLYESHKSQLRGMIDKEYELWGEIESIRPMSIRESTNSSDGDEYPYYLAPRNQIHTYMIGTDGEKKDAIKRLAKNIQEMKDTKREVIVIKQNLQFIEEFIRNIEGRADKLREYEAVRTTDDITADLTDIHIGHLEFVSEGLREIYDIEIKDW
jgi:hypothetical protein